MQYAAFTSLVALMAFGSASAAPAKPSIPAGPDLWTNGTGVDVTVYADGLPANTVTKRENAGVYLCNDRNFGGYCVHIVQPMYECINLGGDLNDQVSAVGPDSPHYCFFFSNFNCNDNEGHFGTYAPGLPDIAASIPNFNDRISSYYCNPS